MTTEKLTSPLSKQLEKPSTKVKRKWGHKGAKIENAAAGSNNRHLSRRAPFPAKLLAYPSSRNWMRSNPVLGECGACVSHHRCLPVTHPTRTRMNPTSVVCTERIDRRSDTAGKLPCTRRLYCPSWPNKKMGRPAPQSRKRDYTPPYYRYAIETRLRRLSFSFITEGRALHASRFKFKVKVSARSRK